MSNKFYPFFIVTNYIKMDETSWTYSEKNKLIAVDFNF